MKKHERQITSGKRAMTHVTYIGFKILKYKAILTDKRKR